jgi:hypothetical protein
VTVDELLVERPNLEDVFLALTGRRIDEAELTAELEVARDAHG